MVNPKVFIQKIKGFISQNPKRAKFVGLLLITAILPLTVLAALTVQNLIQKASEQNAVVRISDAGGNILSSTYDPNVFIDINLNATTGWVLPDQKSSYNNDGLVKSAYAVGLGQFCEISSQCDLGLKCGNIDESGLGQCIPFTSAPSPTPGYTSPTPQLFPTSIVIPTTVPISKDALYGQCLEDCLKADPLEYCRNICGVPPTPTNTPVSGFSSSPAPTSTPAANILRAAYIENKDTDGSGGGSEPIKIAVNSGADIVRIPWKLNDLLPGQTQASRIAQATLIGDTTTIPFTATVNLVRPNVPTNSTQLRPHVYILEDNSGTLFSATETALTQKFYEKYPDKYDFIGFHFIGGNDDGGAYASKAQYTAKGTFWLPTAPLGEGWGSKGRLLGGYVDGFDFDYSYVKRLPVNLAIEYLDTFYFRLIFHEITHYWGVYLPDELKEALRGGYGIKGQPLEKTYDQGHWESFVGSWVSSSPRKKVVQNSEGKYYLKNDCISGSIKHHDFDLYSMGLKSPEDIKEKLVAVKYPPFIEPQGLCGTYEISASEVERVFTIQDMIKILGPRIPSIENSQKDFNIAFVLIVPKGITASREEVDALNWISDKFPIVWYQATEGRSTLNGIKPKDITPPVISNVKTSATKSSITVSWNTNEPTSPIVIYRPINYPFSLVYPNVITNPPKFSTSHTIKIEPTDWRAPVEPNTEHSIMILSIDEDYNMASFDAGKIITTDIPSSTIPSTPTTNTAISSKINYDLNSDGTINCKDTKILVSQYGQKGTNLSADFNLDGTVDGIDYNMIVRNYTPGDTTVCPQ